MLQSLLNPDGEPSLAELIAAVEESDARESLTVEESQALAEQCREVARRFGRAAITIGKERRDAMKVARAAQRERVANWQQQAEANRGRGREREQ